MLFQTSFMNLGTIFAFFAVALTIVFVIFDSAPRWVKVSFLGFRSAIVLIFGLYVAAHIVGDEYYNTNSIRLLAQMIMCFFILTTTSFNQREESFLKHVFIFSSMVYAVMIIVASWNTRVHSRVSLFGTSLDPNFIGIALIAATGIALDMLINNKCKVFYIIAETLFIATIVISGSRGSLLSLASFCVLYFFAFVIKGKMKWYKKILTIVIVFGLIAVILVLFKNILPDYWERLTKFDDNADNGRFELWERAWKTFKDHPLLGIGFGGMYNTFGSATHNTHLQILSEFGLVGYLLFASFIVISLIICWKYNPMYFCVIMAMLVQIMFLDAFDNRVVWAILCLISMIPVKAKEDFTENITDLK